MNISKKYTVIYRFLPCTVAIAIPIKSIAGLLRMYWMNKISMLSIIESKKRAILQHKEVMIDIAATTHKPMN